MILVAFAFAAPAAAGTRTYSGEEAAALRCADMMALTSVALAETGMISEQEKTAILQISVLILVRHVSGSWEQKKAALEVVRDRRNLIETVQDYQRFAAQCLEQFPIN